MPSLTEGLPKAELHVHLFGAIPVPTVLELARRHDVRLPAGTAAGLRDAFRFRDFAHFQEHMDLVRSLLRAPSDLEEATWAFCTELARQGVRYAEVMLGPSHLERAGMPYEAYAAALRSARARALAQLGLDVRWIFDIMRSLPEPPERRYWADYTLEVAMANHEQSDGCVALGLSGSEAEFPPEEFAPWFERARAAGLRSVPHAGEHGGPENVWTALRALHADRIPHGVRAIEDPSLVAYLAGGGVALDMCPTSNVCLGVVPDLASHPLPRLLRAGVPVTVSSDDPTLFGPSLSDEMGLLDGPLGLGPDEVREVVGNAFRYGFEADEDEPVLSP
jgi:aminodeoxyfutalosine deaminase